MSGVMVAKQRKMDIFGAIVLGDVTAVGGGVIRDLILGTAPPVMFERPVYILFATVVCILDFLYERSRADGRLPGKIEQAYARSGEALNAADSIGLAAFVVVGCRREHGRHGLCAVSRDPLPLESSGIRRGRKRNRKKRLTRGCIHLQLHGRTKDHCILTNMQAYAENEARAFLPGPFDRLTEDITRYNIRIEI